MNTQYSHLSFSLASTHNKLSLLQLENDTRPLFIGMTDSLSQLPAHIPQNSGYLPKENNQLERLTEIGVGSVPQCVI